MGKELFSYIRAALRQGLSDERIERELRKKGYGDELAKGALHAFHRRRKRSQFAILGAFLAVLATSLFLAGSGVVGMMTLGYSSTYTDTLDIIATGNGEFTWVPSVQGDIASISLNGNLIGEGKAYVFLPDDEEPLVVLDTEKDAFTFTQVSSAVLGEKLVRFERACRDTCYLEGFARPVFGFMVEVEDATLEIESVTYEVRRSLESEKLPAFSELPPQTLGVNERLRIDLSAFFPVPARFRALNSDDILSVDISGSIATLTAKRPGSSQIYFLADVDGATSISPLLEVEVLPIPSDTERTLSRSLSASSDPSSLPNIPGRPLWPALLLAALLAFVGGIIALPSSPLYLPHLVSKLSSPGNVTVEEFYDLAERFRKGDREGRKKLYPQLEKRYQALLKQGLPARDKKKIYQMMMDFYEQVK